jgi:hypothetical protein
MESNEMKKNLKAWTALGAAISTATSAYAFPANHNKTMIHQDQHQSVLLAAAAGEGEGVSAEKYSESDFVKDFGLIEGHLTAGVELYTAGEVAQAKTHMKHPEDEIYADLIPEIEERGTSGIADEISAIASVVENGGSADEATKRLKALKAAIDRSAAPTSAKERAEAIEKLVRVASEEYAIGVKDGAITDPHEYQDAYGFVQAAKRLSGNLPAETESEYGEQFADIRSMLDKLSDLWPDLTAKSGKGGDPSRLAGTAARIELVALSIKN